MNAQLSAQDALIYVMVMASAVDRTMNDRELGRIGELIEALPVFKGFDEDRLIAVSRDCATLLSGAEGWTSCWRRSATPCRPASTTPHTRSQSRSPLLIFR